MATRKKAAAKQVAKKPEVSEDLSKHFPDVKDATGVYRSKLLSYVKVLKDLPEVEPAIVWNDDTHPQHTVWTEWVKYGDRVLTIKEAVWLAEAAKSQPYLQNMITFWIGKRVNDMSVGELMGEIEG